ncbi:MAG: endolytic transglycosylase MltG [Candidatus Nealsonbacteria bacterium]|nr:endolytic transglycosylase MltG [Candidatus Nealsonbacteria bacterium]
MNKMITRNKKIIIAIVIVLIIITPIGIYQLFFSAPNNEFESERIVVNLGTTEEELISKLREQGYIKNERAFRFVLKLRDLEGEIKPGGYKISKSWNVWKMALALANFRYQYWVVVPEGLRKEEVAEAIGKKLSWEEETKEEFIANSKEGYLFPDTYLLDFDYTGTEVAKRMENKLNEEVADLFEEATENNIRNDTLIVLASLVQREAANAEQMPLIAGIIWNRWLQDMKFEIDATVQYALGRPGNWWPKVRPEDYKADSPYNTYLHKGRPPRPICNPGLAAIDAVINSQDSEYLYYLHDDEGQIHLAKSYEEHLQNIEKHLK